MLHTSKPFLLIDAKRIAAEIRVAPASNCVDVTMNRSLIQLEDELDELTKAAHLTLDALDSLRMLITARRLDVALSKDNPCIAQCLAEARHTDKTSI